MAKTYQVQIIVTSQDDDTVDEEWVFDIDGDKLTPYEIATFAKDGAKGALTRHDFECTGDTH